MALSLTSYFISIGQRNFEKLLSHVSAQTGKTMVTKLIIVTNLSAARALVTGKTVSWLEAGVLVFVYLGLNTIFNSLK